MWDVYVLDGGERVRFNSEPYDERQLAEAVEHLGDAEQVIVSHCAYPSLVFFLREYAALSSAASLAGETDSSMP